MPSFGTTLARSRKTAGLQQRDLATALGVAVSTISAWERDLTAPDANMLRTIADTLNVSADVLLERKAFEYPERLAHPVQRTAVPSTKTKIEEAASAFADKLLGTSVKPSTTPKWSWDTTEPSTVGVTLAGEEKRAIGPKDREKWSLSTCAKTIDCPSCGALKRFPCKSGRNCRGRLWALAAHRRRDVPVDLRYTEEIVEIGRVAHAGGFRAKFKNVDGEWAAFAGDDEISTIRDCALEYAIECGLVVLAEEECAPVWKLSDRWLDERRVPHLKLVTNDEDIAKRDDEWVKSVH